jgi:hypothetical protein
LSSLYPPFKKHTKKLTMYMMFTVKIANDQNWMVDSFRVPDVK